MLPEVRNYLEEVRSHLHLDPLTEKRVIGELYTYFQEKVTELQEQGMSEREAAVEAIGRFGRARVVARLMYEAHSKGSWVEAVITSLPHLMIAGLFVSHLWRHLVLAPIVFASIVGVTLFGWWHGKPNWLYSWVGYSLLPLLIIGYGSRLILERAISFLLRGEGLLSSAWLVGLFSIFCFLSLWVIITTTIRVVKRDWILASLMLVPLPIVGSWLFNLEQLGGLFQNGSAALYRWDGVMALVLTVLGVTSATFIRLRQRVLKVGALVTIGSISVAMLGHNLWGGLGLVGILTLSLSTLVFLLTPALVEARIGHGEQKGEAWWSGDWVERPSLTGQ
jgi:hypothetical protein